ncbi:hypothetical protein B0T26DRAFT_669744 [Lasiosphaeria miniovina]|uniref:BZIP transcription factor n=1 Tax=Lasiosphaeria miniovina TaxID=1954250 RepID=A0AA40EB06_9PEZI|nr:uncharacterized protein B0T26DRAFT_669744 [Lasiosphaeria miniovina]KAK0733325.1 hypothetical protein B0T26DRAFT_669744 [Lasiosphaeria miniovina]
MTRSPSAEAARPSSKRKGTRSVSTLTPSQLARKRANDREAQRAIRARTKEHIERLEREVEELKGRQSRDETVRGLTKRNKALERELMALRERLGTQGRPYPAPGMLMGNMCEPPLQGLTVSGSGYDLDGLPAAARSGVSSRASAEYNTVPAFRGSYLPTPEPCDSWSSVVPVSSVSVPSVVSSPCSSTGYPDDYVPGYIPTSVPSTMMENNVINPSTISCLDGSKVEYEELDAGADQGYSHTSVRQTSNYLQQQSWNMYPTAAYYSQSPSL